MPNINVIIHTTVNFVKYYESFIYFLENYAGNNYKKEAARKSWSIRINMRLMLEPTL